MSSKEPKPKAKSSGKRALSPRAGAGAGAGTSPIKGGGAGAGAGAAVEENERSRKRARRTSGGGAGAPAPAPDGAGAAGELMVYGGGSEDEVDNVGGDGGELPKPGALLDAADVQSPFGLGAGAGANGHATMNDVVTAIRLSERVSSVTHDVEGVKTTLALLQNQIHALSPAARSPKTSSSSKLIKVNVGGKMFTTRRSTFENAEGTYFESLVSDRWEVDRDEEGNIFIDRDPKHFSVILNWLRDRVFSGEWPLDDKSFHHEANFYGLSKEMLGDLLYMAYGYDGASRLDTIECYNPLLDSWKTVAKMQTPLSSPSCAALGEYIYTTGGKNNDNQAVGTVTRFHPQTKLVKIMAPLNVLRFGHGLVVLNGQLFAVGGYGDDGGRVRSVEKFNAEENAWEEVAGLNCVRSALGCAVLNGKIYVAGGYGPSQNGNQSNMKLSTVEAYDPVANVWKEVEPLKQARAHVCCIGHQGKLWAIGGYDGEHASQRVECYDPKTGKWENGPPLNEKRSVVVCSVVGGRL